MDRIRLIEAQDYRVLSLFWALAGDFCNARDIYPAKSSYVYERDGKLLYCVAVYEIKDMPFAYVEAVIRDPNKAADFNALAALEAHLEADLKIKGIKRVVGFPKNDQLAKHYERLGYNRYGTCITASKELT